MIDTTAVFTDAVKMILFFAVFSAISVQAASPPQCTWPTDMANARAVTAYEQCYEKQKSFCDRKENALACKSIKDRLRRRIPYLANPADINPTERCYILKDNAYKCFQDPVRFVSKEPAKVAATPTPSATGSPAASPSSSPSSLETPSGSSEGGIVVPPMPPPPPLAVPPSK